MQKAFYLATESITMAMKGYRILSRNGINSRVKRTNATFSGRGCGHSIVVYSNPNRALEILKRNNIRIISVSER